MLLTFHFILSHFFILSVSLCVIGCHAGAKEKGQRKREAERGSWVTPCDLASCCCMLVGETEREVRGRNRGEGREGGVGSSPPAHNVTGDNPLFCRERERGEAAGDEHTHAHAQAGM